MRMAATGYGHYRGVVPSIRSVTVLRRFAVAGVLAATFLAGCGGSADGPNAGPGASGTGVSDSVPAALDFSAPLVGGGSFDGATMAGRPVAFWFWAPT